MPGFEWREQGMDKMLVKPMNTEELMRQIEALLVTHEDKKQKASLNATSAQKTPVRQVTRKVAKAT
jgi:DNA-binding response OmpR family regulator